MKHSEFFQTLLDNEQVEYGRAAKKVMLSLKPHEREYFQAAHASGVSSIMYSAISFSLSAPAISLLEERNGQYWYRHGLPRRHIYGSVWFTISVCENPSRITIETTGKVMHS